ncbi:MAG: hypothetical protein GXO27_03375 [Chlorobi bacterium]|nr:hypothetical protein [Chlorobiota bacterium]
MKTKIFINAIVWLLVALPVRGQVAINSTGADPDASAMLDVQATDKGVLIPRLTTADRLNISNPAVGLMVYDADLNAFTYYDGNTWVFFSTVDEIDDLSDGKSDGASLFLGQNAGTSASPATYNTGVGIKSFENITSGAYNVGIGYQALQNATTAQYNVGVGYNVLKNLTEGENNVAVGTDAGLNITTGNENTALGYSSLNTLTSGTRNVAVGSYALAQVNTGSNNVAVGPYSLFNATGDYAVAIGAEAAYNLTSAVDVVAIGYQALRATTTAEANTAVGSRALKNNTGIENTAVGAVALFENTSGEYNVAVGGETLQDNTTGSYNTALGALALSTNVSGERNVAVGHGAGSSTASGGNATQVSQSVFLGAESSPQNEDDTNEIVIGYQAEGLGSNTVVIGNDNITTTALKGFVGIGTTAPATALHVVGVVRIQGVRLQITEFDGSDNFWINDGTEEGSFLAFRRIGSPGSYTYEMKTGDPVNLFNMAYTNVRIGDLNSNAPRKIDLNDGGWDYALNLPNDGTAEKGKARAYAWDTYSDARIKSRLRPIDRVDEIIDGLKPLKYFHHFSQFIKDEKTNQVVGIRILDKGEERYGFLAQDLYKVVPELVHKPKNEQTDLWSVNYTGLIPILTAAIKKQKEELARQKAMIQKQQEEINELKEIINKLQTKIGE